MLNIDNFRRRQWAPAIKASGVCKPARIYDLRSTFASNAIAAGVSVFELARTIGTSIEMIERHYGTLLDGSASGIAGKMAEFERQQARSDERLGHASAVDIDNCSSKHARLRGFCSAPGEIRTPDLRFRRPRRRNRRSTTISTNPLQSRHVWDPT
ncbi:MAG: hypothetical protein ACLP8S_10295 [Solirubrobacteraceae bacterium]